MTEEATSYSTESEAVMARETVTRADLDRAASELNGLLHTSVGHVRVDLFHAFESGLVHYVVVLDNGDPVTRLSEPGTIEETLRSLKALPLGAGLTREMVRRVELSGLRWTPDHTKNVAVKALLDRDGGGN